jgi:hypothetical protein
MSPGDLGSYCLLLSAAGSHQDLTVLNIRRSWVVWPHPGTPAP